MKKFKILEDLTECELFDLSFFMTDLSKEVTGLQRTITTIAKCEFNRNIPCIFVFEDFTDINSKYSMFKISSRPFELYDGLYINADEYVNILKFIKTNKKILMKYWNWKCSSFELKNNTKEINERTNRI